MTPQQMIFLSSIFIMFFMLFIIFLIKRKEILSFFFPNKWVIVEMLELDNNCLSWLQPKNQDLRFKFNDGYYHLYHQAIDEKTNVIKNPSIYREGRLAKFFYHEGNSDPMDYRLGKITGNPQISRQMETMEVSKLFDENRSVAQEFFNKYGLFIVGIIIIIVIYLLMKKPDQAVQTIQPAIQG
jgi:hypothetical protein